MTRLPVIPGRYPRDDERENCDGRAERFHRQTSVEPSEIAFLAFIERAESPRVKEIWQTPRKTNHQEEDQEEDEVGRPFGWCWRFFPPAGLLRVTQQSSRVMVDSPLIHRFNAAA